jgi:hypothetical protein
MITTIAETKAVKGASKAIRIPFSLMRDKFFLHNIQIHIPFSLSISMGASCMVVESSVTVEVIDHVTTMKLI